MRMLGVGLPVLSGCTKPAAYPPHLFACDQRRLVDIATKVVGHQITPYGIERSSSGDQLRMVVRGNAVEGRTVVVSLNRPPVILTPGKAYGSVLDDNLDVIAWGEDGKQALYFRSGYVQEIPHLAVSLFAPGAAYYCVSSGPQHSTWVYATERPGMLLGQVGFVAQDIFWKQGSLYLFGWDANSKQLEITGGIFRDECGKLRRETDIRIRAMRSAATFGVADLDPQTDHLLCRDSRDEFGAKWFVYNLRSHTLTDIGELQTYGLFLQDALIRRLVSI